MICLFNRPHVVVRHELQLDVSGFNYQRNGKCYMRFRTCRQRLFVGGAWSKWEKPKIRIDEGGMGMSAFYLNHNFVLYKIQ